MTEGKLWASIAGCSINLSFWIKKKTTVFYFVWCPSSAEPCQSVHAAVPRAFILFITPAIPYSSLHRPIKAWFSTLAGQPGRFAARDRWEAGEVGEVWGGRWASIWAQEGCWALASNWTENSLALTYRPGGATTHTLTQLENLLCTNRKILH